MYGWAVVIAFKFCYSKSVVECTWWDCPWAYRWWDFHASVAYWHLRL